MVGGKGSTPDLFPVGSGWRKPPYAGKWRKLGRKTGKVRRVWEVVILGRYVWY